MSKLGGDEKQCGGRRDGVKGINVLSILACSCSRSCDPVAYISTDFGRRLCRHAIKRVQFCLCCSLPPPQPKTRAPTQANCNGGTAVLRFDRHTDCRRVSCDRSAALPQASKSAQPPRKWQFYMVFAAREHLIVYRLCKLPPDSSSTIVFILFFFQFKQELQFHRRIYSHRFIVKAKGNGTNLYLIT